MQEPIRTDVRKVLRQPGLLQVLSGRKVDLLALTEDQIFIEDIAWGLGRTLRYGGHIKQDYTVAHHCVIMSYLVPESFALEALLHDAAESYMGDIIWPVKAMFPVVESFENQIMLKIMDRFEVPVAATNGGYVKSGYVADADIAMLEHESWSFGRGGTFLPEVENKWLAAAMAHESYWYAGQYAYLERFDQLMGTNHCDLEALTRLWFPEEAEELKAMEEEAKDAEPEQLEIEFKDLETPEDLDDA
jgi:hypothetical protein